MTTGWTDLLGFEKKKPYFLSIQQSLQEFAQQGHTIYPPKHEIFQSFSTTSYTDVKAVILGQDPYHGPGQAHGLSFSVPETIPQPPSLKNIFKALEYDLNISAPNHGNLIEWAKQGVLLLNTTLTVSQGQPQSHSQIGWQMFTDTVISHINNHPEAIVFMLWGAHAQKKASLITNPKHLVLQSVHPSPLSAHRGFLQCKHFSKTNDWLQQHHRAPIDWNIL